MDNNIPDWKGRTALATTNNYNAGKIAGEYLKTRAQGRRHARHSRRRARRAVARRPRQRHARGPRRASNVKIVGKGATNCTEELGISVAEDLLTANPDLKAIYAACGPPAAGAAQAIKNAGIANDAIVLVGFDFCCGEAEALEAGIEDATVAQFPTKMARTRRRCAGQGDPRREGRIADRLGRGAGHQGQHGRLPVEQYRGPAPGRPLFPSGAVVSGQLRVKARPGDRRNGGR